MPCGTWTITDVPSAQVDSVVGGFNMQGALSVDTKQQPDGDWTVTAEFPPCETTQSYGEYSGG